MYFSFGTLCSPYIVYDRYSLFCYYYDAHSYLGVIYLLNTNYVFLQKFRHTVVRESTYRIEREGTKERLMGKIIFGVIQCISA